MAALRQAGLWTGGILAAWIATGVGASPRADLGAHALHLDGAAAGEVCVFCHSPGAATGARPSVTLASTGGDGPAPHAVENNPSIACLTCHDGTQAPDVAANMPIAGGQRPFAVAGYGTSGDHPVGIPFTARPDRGRTGTVARVQRAVIDNRTEWWVDAESLPNGRRDKSDVILYTRADAGRETPYIECASCHDPHAPKARMFLRMSNAGSRLCQTCHSY